MQKQFVGKTRTPCCNERYFYVWAKNKKQAKKALYLTLREKGMLESFEDFKKSVLIYFARVKAPIT